MSALRRYLIEFSYFGTRFSGVQMGKIKTKHGEKYVSYGNPNLFIENLLQNVIHKVDPYYANYIGASRTDAGVHALHTAAHVDMVIKVNPNLKKTKKIQQEDYLCNFANKYFHKTKTEMRLKKVTHVPFHFHARVDAVSRKYIYRFAILPNSRDVTGVKNPSCYDALLPIAELNRTYAIMPPFDMDKANELCRLFEGFHNFSGLAANQTKRLVPQTMKRSIDEVKIVPGTPLMDPKHDPLYEGLQFFELHVTAKSFFYHQIRKIMGLVQRVAGGYMHTDLVRDVLQTANPLLSETSLLAPAHGLYLAHIEYPADAFDFSLLDADRLPFAKYEHLPNVHNYDNVDEPLTDNRLSNRTLISQNT